MSDLRRAALEELVRRKQAREAVDGLTSGILGECFLQQTHFIEDPSKYKSALCTRRAGKTGMWTRYCSSEALKNERALIRIWAVSRLRAKQLLWDEFKYLLQRHRVPVEYNETELTIRFANGSEIRLLGADKDKEVQKKRGDKTWMEVVLEAQGFGPYLKTLVEDVAEPCLMDERKRGGGIFCLDGTPGPVCAGYWYEVTGRDDFSSRWQSVGAQDCTGAGWSCHRWSVLDNPHMQHARDELAKMKTKKRWTDSHPTYVREWLGKWVSDAGSLFYKFNEGRNNYDTSQVQPWGPGWEHTLGWDLGSRDDMALVVWGYHPQRENLYEAFSWKQPGALAHEVMAQIEALEKRGFNFVKMVADTGGGGKMYVEEVQFRFGRQFDAAKKTEKYEHARLLNDDLLTAHVLLRPGSELAVEMAQLPIDPDWPDPDKPDGPPFEDSRFPNHACDAALYSYRAARHYLHTPGEDMPKQGTPAHMKRLEDEHVRRLQEPKQRDWWEPDPGAPDIGALDGFFDA